ncbi:uncharacterized protein BJ171DRAFT_611562 [Polychytrium aggregatum]|uniref:uncharacterized protein n=1 Tax=Polychytrium aggregatum TaxID=110093 RepID=UPI0022FE05CF|nr:uncharacterized protein BJ171DRAFT_611562 [Polychytrium aggregatum]KAI9206495.1 hypothetical protein BJ171DRAFT_611562 [Polychytrium aggregatum]
MVIVLAPYPFHVYQKKDTEKFLLDLAVLVAALPINTNKTLFKAFTNTFTGEDAISTILSLPALGLKSKDAAVERMDAYLEARLLINVEKPFEDTFRSKYIYAVSYKGEEILKDVKMGKLTHESLESSHLHGFTIQSKLAYIDRTASGKISLGFNMAEVLFKRFCGKEPNITEKSERTGPIYPGESPSKTPSSVNLGDIDGVASAIQLKNRSHLREKIPMSFSGHQAVTWFLDSTSILTRAEGIVIGSHYLSLGWIQSAGDSGEKTLVDSKHALYQFTPVAMGLAGWPVSFVEEAMRQMDKQGLRKRGLARGADEPPPGTSLISKDNLEKFERILRKSQEMLDGDSTRDSTASSVVAASTRVSTAVSHKPSVKRVSGLGADFDEMMAGPPTEESGVRPSIANNNASTTRHRAHTSSEAKPSTAAGGRAESSRVSTVLSPTAQKAKTGPLAEQFAKESNSNRLTTIIENQDLADAFQKFLCSTFCEENFLFWVDADRFRKMYGAPLAGADPSVPVKPQDIILNHHKLKEISHVYLIPHALALYQKYIARDSPFEVNIGSNLRRQICAIIESLGDSLKLIDINTLKQPTPVDPMEVILAPHTPSDFPATTDGFSATMFDGIQTHLFRLMSTDSTPKFTKTEIYQELFWSYVSQGLIAPRVAAPNLTIERRRSSTIQTRPISQIVQPTQAPVLKEESETYEMAVPIAGSRKTSLKISDPDLRPKNSTKKASGSGEENGHRRRSSIANINEAVQKSGAL